MSNPVIAESMRLIKALEAEVRKPVIQRPEALIRFEKRYCDLCMCEHWVQVVRYGNQVCHGEHYTPKNTETHYTRWRAGGIEVVAKISTAQMSLDWQMREEANKEDYSWLDLV